ncbi:AAA+ ATPase domain [Penicillium digitatum]|uniref:AAA+ ATPase domain n=1 Tax=Penicillium digitatum TaxID=36651 RepID=A0A7T6XKR4_PENDI|nr:AAA+ ATPase domain [Penicillium digitatum]
MALEPSSPSHQSLMPPDSPMEGSATPQATAKDPKHLFGVLKKVLFDLTNRNPPNTPVFQDHSQPGPDIVQLKQLLEKVIRKRHYSAEPPKTVVETWDKYLEIAAESKEEFS